MPGWKGERGTRQERGYGRLWERLREAVLRRDSHLCQTCLKQGRTTPAREVDHVTPKAKGGTDDLDNLQGICTPCHADKTSREAIEAAGGRVKVQIGPDGWPVRQGAGQG